MSKNDNCTLLLVEDSRDEVYFVRRAWMSQAPAYQLTHVFDGEEAKVFLLGAQERAKVQGDALPRVILSDLMMPRCDGIELLTWVRAQPRLGQLPVVIWSTSQHRGDIDAAYAKGANGYLIKPREPTQTAAVLARIQHFWSETNLSPGQIHLPYPVQ